jgi:hypothetical protein
MFKLRVVNALTAQTAMDAGESRYPIPRCEKQNGEL